MLSKTFYPVATPSGGVGPGMVSGVVPMVIDAGGMPQAIGADNPVPMTSSGLPAALGPQLASASVSVVPASDYEPRATQTATIPSGQSVSNAIDLQGTVLLNFIAPAAWTAAALNFEVSMDNSNWITAGVFDSSGVATGQYAAIVVGASYAVDFNALLGYRYIRLRSGTAASVVNQGAARAFTLITRPIA